MITTHRATALFLCGLFFVIQAPSSCAQNDRWDKRDTWQNVPGILEAMTVQPGSYVADIGAREGYLTMRLAKAVGAEGRIYAVDIDNGSLKKLWKNLSAEDTSRVKLVHSKPDDPMLPEAMLDAAVVVNAYHEFEAYEAMLEHILQALKPGGRLVIVEPISERRRSAMREVQERHHEIGIGYARADLEAAGFEVLDAHDPFVKRKSQGDEMWLLVGRRPMMSR